MNHPVVIVGLGEMGDLFARGFLKIGRPVYPVLRGMNSEDIASDIPSPELILVAVGEDDLHPVLETMPQAWRGRMGLLQNELLPRDWQRHGIADPTVVVVWFDKKKGRPFVNVLPTPVCGPNASLITRALQAIEVPCWEIPREELVYQLVRKNLYILTINIAGMQIHPGATVQELWEGHRALAEGVAGEILTIQEHLTRSELPRAKLMAGMVEGFEGDPCHICTGRSALLRLQRALSHASQAGLATPLLQDILDQHRRWPPEAAGVPTIMDAHGSATSVCSVE